MERTVSMQAHVDNQPNTNKKLPSLHPNSMTTTDESIKADYISMISQFTKFSTSDEAPVEPLAATNGALSKEDLLMVIRNLTLKAKDTFFETGKKFIAQRQLFYGNNEEKYREVVMEQLRFQEILIMACTDEAIQKHRISNEIYENSVNTYWDDGEIKEALENMSIEALQKYGNVPEDLSEHKLKEMLQNSCDFISEYITAHPQINPMELMIFKSRVSDENMKRFGYDELQVSSAIAKYRVEENPNFREINTKLNETTVKLSGFNPIEIEILSRLGPYNALPAPEDLGPRIKLCPALVENHAVYIGEWNLKHQKCGFGTQISADGARYEGYWKENKAHGQGRLIYADGDVYEGEWKENKMQGEGTYWRTDGSRYKGRFEDGLEHGYGLETYPDGGLYEGEYLNGKKNGKGKFIWPDGSVYEGELLDNNIHGIGTYTWADGRKYVGEWAFNKKNGAGTFTTSDGSIYIGDHKDDKRHGHGMLVWPDGSMYEGSWINGKQDGLGFFTTTAGKRKEGEWSDGKRIKWIEDAKHK